MLDGVMIIDEIYVTRKPLSLSGSPPFSASASEINRFIANTSALGFGFPNSALLIPVGLFKIHCNSM